MNKRAEINEGAVLSGDSLGGRRVGVQVVEGMNLADGDSPVLPDMIGVTQLHDYLSKNGVEINALSKAQRVRLVASIDAMLLHLKAAKAASDTVQRLLAEFRANG